MAQVKAKGLVSFWKRHEIYDLDVIGDSRKIVKTPIDGRLFVRH
jgi:hypothetical protein